MAILSLEILAGAVWSSLQEKGALKTESVNMDLCQTDLDRCKSCGLCVEFCPKNALAMSHEYNAIGCHPAFLKDVASCNGCALCAEMCPETAIRVYRRTRRSATCTPKHHSRRGGGWFSGMAHDGVATSSVLEWAHLQEER